MYVVYFRIVTRALLIPFSAPAISAGSEDDDLIFEELDILYRGGQLSRLIGWIVSLGSSLSSLEDVAPFKSALRGSMNGRRLLNWAILLHFTNKVSNLCVGRSLNMR